MKVALIVNINDSDLNRKCISATEILDKSLTVLSALYDQYGLKYDCGYNPATITTGISS